MPGPNIQVFGISARMFEAGFKIGAGAVEAESMSDDLEGQWRLYRWSWGCSCGSSVNPVLRGQDPGHKNAPL